MVDDIQPPEESGPAPEEMPQQAKQGQSSRDRISRERIAQVKKTTPTQKSPSAVGSTATSSSAMGKFRKAGNIAKAVKSGNTTELGKAAASKAAGKAAQAAVAAGTGGVGTVAAPVVGKVAEKVVGEGLNFFQEHKGIAVVFLLSILLGPFAMVVQIPLFMYASIIYFTDHVG